MPLVKRCIICGRVVGREHSAKPYKTKGCACDECYVNRVVPAIKIEEDRKRKKHG